MARIISQNLQFQEFSGLDELEENHHALMLKAREACHDAYAPYSGFQVGAALRLDNDLIVVGNNQENAAYPSGLCAERVALFAAHSQHPGLNILTIAISACRKGHTTYLEVSPCGGCRQVMMEFQSLQDRDIEVLMEGPDGTIYLLSSIDTLLPLKFSKNSLGTS